MPGITRTIGQSLVQKFAQNPTSILSQFYLSFATLELLDRFSLFSIGPICLGLGLVVTVAY